MSDEETAATPLPQPEAPQDRPTQTAISPEGRPQIRIDPAMVAETLQRKNAQLMSQIVYDNAVLETALETAYREIGDLKAKNEALQLALQEQ